VPKVKQEASINSLRHAEYYGMQQTYDDLYAKSKNRKLNKQKTFAIDGTPDEVKVSRPV